ncbi:MAG: hypothetical protein KAG99_10465 [Bacteroidales bacterium]|nr:hypothetical protein [Bacteroidales bacterium]
MKLKENGFFLYLKNVSVILILLLFVSSCGVIEQVGQMKTLSRCDFILKSIENISLAELSIDDMHSINDLSMMDVAMITMSFAKGQLPLKFTLNVEISNPNDQVASMNKLDWILLIDDIEMTRGVTNRRVEVLPGGKAMLPLQFNMDLTKLLSGESANAVMNFGFNLAGYDGMPSRVILKAKPTIMVGNSEIAYPGYISISM